MDGGDAVGCSDDEDDGAVKAPRLIVRCTVLGKVNYSLIDDEKI